MRVFLRPLAPGEADGEGVALAIILASAALAGTWLVLGLPTPACLFHTATGLPCLTCGGTRTARALLHGDLAQALSWNPVVFAGFVAAAVFVIYAALVVALRLPRVRISLGAGTESHAWRVVIALLLAGNWIYLLVRGT